MKTKAIRVQNSTARRETVNLILNALVTSLSARVRSPGADHPMLSPTVFVPARRGSDLTWKDVAASRV